MSTKKNLEGLNETAYQIFQNNKEKGFWDNERNVGELLMLVTSELGEAMEAHRKGKFTKNEDWELYQKKYNSNEVFKLKIKDTFEDEIADSIIRLLDMCGGLGINIESHIVAKLEYNKSRPRLHGKEY